jgi:hypothetical protein
LVAWLVAGLLILVPLPAASQAVFEVSRPDDRAETCFRHDCSLREAVLAANTYKLPAGAHHRIIVPPGLYRLDISGPDEDDGATGDLDIRQAMVIEGAGIGTTMIVGGSDRVFHVQSGVSAVIANLTIHGGGTTPEGKVSPDVSGGGGILTNGNLALQFVDVRGNQAPEGGGIMQDGGTLRIERSAIVFNYGRRAGGGLLVRNGTASISTTTFGWNGAETGGALWTGQRVTLDSVTIAMNSAVIAPGIYSSARRLASLNRTIVDQLFGSCYNEVASGGFNIDRDGTCGLGSVGDGIAIDPLLGEAGAAPFFVPRWGSPAVDAFDCPPGVDQRGVLRPVDGDENTVPRCDIGAIEVTPSSDYSDMHVTIFSPSVLAGRVERWTVRLTNHGPATDWAPFVVEPAAGLSDVWWLCVPDWSSRCASTGGSGSVVSTVRIPPGGVVDIYVYGGVSPTATGALVTHASVWPAATTDTYPSNNRFRHSVAVIP